MLLRAYKAENKKLKGSAIWLAFFLVPLFPAIMGTFNYLGNLDILNDGWYSLWTQHTLFYANFFFAPLIGVYCSYLWRLEHLGHNWHLILTMPVTAFNLFCSKFLVAYKTTVVTQAWVLFLFFISGKFAGLPGIIPPVLLLWTLRGTLGAAGIVSLQLLLSMCIRSFSIPVLIALVGSMLGLAMASAGKGLLWPYSLLLMGMNANRSADALAGPEQQIAYFFATVLFLAFFFMVAVISLKKRNVQTI